MMCCVVVCVVLTGDVLVGCCGAAGVLPADPARGVAVIEDPVLVVPSGSYSNTATLAMCWNTYTPYVES